MAANGGRCGPGLRSGALCGGGGGGEGVYEWDGGGVRGVQRLPRLGAGGRGRAGGGGRRGSPHSQWCAARAARRALLPPCRGVQRAGMTSAPRRRGTAWGRGPRWGGGSGGGGDPRTPGVPGRARRAAAAPRPRAAPTPRAGPRPHHTFAVAWRPHPSTAPSQPRGPAYVGPSPPDRVPCARPPARPPARRSRAPARADRGLTAPGVSPAAGPPHAGRRSGALA
jgi:hypothetical protein